MVGFDVNLPHDWTPRKYQRPLWNHFVQDRFEKGLPGQRGVAVWHRRAGKDATAINLIGVKSMQRVGTYWHVSPTFAQGRDIIWDGLTYDGRSFLSFFPPAMIEGEPNNTEMKINFKNGSVFKVMGADKPGRLVGTNPVGIVFSEFSLMDPNVWRYTMPILRQNKGWVLFIYTIRGGNHGWDHLQMATRNPDWFSEVLCAGDNGTKLDDGVTPVVSDEDIAKDRDEGMPEELIQQEYYNSPDAPMVGAYYGKEMEWLRKEGRIVQGVYDPALSVSTYWDLGIDDSMSIWYAQFLYNEVRLARFYENSGEGFAHYINEINSHGYTLDEHWGPWDLEVREMGTGKSRREAARKLGLRFRVVRKHDLLDGIEQCRQILRTCWFDETTCAHGISSLRSYRKDRDEKKGIFGTKPLRDWTTHAADAFRTLAMSRRSNVFTKPNNLPRKAQDSWR